MLTQPAPQSIYITSAEGNSGKSTIALGVLDTLARSFARVGVFRPLYDSRAGAKADRANRRVVCGEARVRQEWDPHRDPMTSSP